MFSPVILSLMVKQGRHLAEGQAAVTALVLKQIIDKHDFSCRSHFYCKLYGVSFI